MVLLCSGLMRSVRNSFRAGLFRTSFCFVPLSGCCVSQNCPSRGGKIIRGTLSGDCGIVDGVSADSLDRASGCILVIPGMWIATDNECYSSASSSRISATMLLRLVDLDDPFKIDDKADKLSDRTWNVTEVVFVVLQARKATRITRASHRVSKAGPPLVALYLMKSRSAMSSAK
jgi:hypothetical protein